MWKVSGMQKKVHNLSMQLKEELNIVHHPVKHLNITWIFGNHSVFLFVCFIRFMRIVKGWEGKPQKMLILGTEPWPGCWVWARDAPHLEEVGCVSWLAPVCSNAGVNGCPITRSLLPFSDVLDSRGQMHMVLLLPSCMIWGKVLSASRDFSHLSKGAKWHLCSRVAGKIGRIKWGNSYKCI